MKTVAVGLLDPGDDERGDVHALVAEGGAGRRHLQRRDLARYRARATRSARAPRGSPSGGPGRRPSRARPQHELGVGGVRRDPRGIEEGRGRPARCRRSC